MRRRRPQRGCARPGTGEAPAPDSWAHRSHLGRGGNSAGARVRDTLPRGHGAAGDGTRLLQEIWHELGDRACAGERLLEESAEKEIGGVPWQILLVPGHCPGSLCFLDPKSNFLFGGDVLFAGSVGRTDLPGGDAELLFTGIRQKLFTLHDDVKVFPGHGPATTIGIERRTNPYVGERAVKRAPRRHRTRLPSKSIGLPERPDCQKRCQMDASFWSAPVLWRFWIALPVRSATRGSAPRRPPKAPEDWRTPKRKRGAAAGWLSLL